MSVFLTILFASIMIKCIHSFEISVRIDNHEKMLIFDCSTNSQKKALEFCTTNNIQPSNDCISSLSTTMSKTQGTECSMLMEHWLDRPVKDWLERLQWKILNQSTYRGVRTWKFPFDAWVYREILYQERPTVIIEIGNFAGGSALLFADLFDTMEHHAGRIIAVDIDHSNVHEKARSHPRITWIEADAVVAFDSVASMIDPIHDKVIVIEDASHTHAHTLAIMQHYGNLVTNGSYMIIEDTVLHNGVKNDAFRDAGAYQAVKDFSTSNEFGCGWKVQRHWERYIVTWNPTGFLQKVHPHGACNEKSHNQFVFNQQQFHKQWRNAPLDYSRFINLITSKWNNNILLSDLKIITIPTKNGDYSFNPISPDFKNKNSNNKEITIEQLHAIASF
jgi:cephalosporin hydroxylase